MSIVRGQISTLGIIGSATSQSTAWSVNPTAGNTILIFIQTNGTISSVIDNGVSPTTFTLDIQPATSPGIHIYRANGITLPASGSYTVTVTTGSATTIMIGGIEYSGVQPGAPASTNSGTNTSTSVTTGSATGVLCFGGFFDNTSLNPETITYTGPGTQQFVNTNGSGYWAAACADLISSGSNAHTWTLGDSVLWQGVVAAYNAAAPASAGNFNPTYPRKESNRRNVGPMALRNPTVYLPNPLSAASPTAGNASAPTSAYSPTPAAGVLPSTGAVSASAQTPTPAVGATPATATASAGASQPKVEVDVTNVGQASAAASANPATPLVGATPGGASAGAAAFNATVTTGSSAHPGGASAGAAAFNATVEVDANPGTASATTSSGSSVIEVDASAGLAAVIASAASSVTPIPVTPGGPSESDIPFSASIPGYLPGSFTNYGLFSTSSAGASFLTPELPGMLPSTLPFALCSYSSMYNGALSSNYVQGVGWELKVYSGRTYTYMTTIPRYQSLSFNIALNNEGAGQVVIDRSDTVFLETLSTGGPGTDLIDDENVWQAIYNGQPIFEFLGTDVVETIVDASSEAQPVTISGAGTARMLQWAEAVPPGFPNEVFKISAVADTFQLSSLNPVFWNLTSPAAINAGQVYVDVANSRAAIAGTNTTYAVSPALAGGNYDVTSSAISAQITPLNMPIQPTNVIANYSFQLGLEGWDTNNSGAQTVGATAAVYTADSFDGDGFCAQVVATGAHQGIEQTVPALNPITYYQFNAWVKVKTSGQPTCTVYDSTNSKLGYPGSVVATIGEWSLIQASIRTGSLANVNLVCSVNSGTGASNFLVDTALLYEYTPFTSNAMMLSSAASPTTNYVMMELDCQESNQRLWARVFNNGVQSSIYLTSTYDPVQHNYWRIREFNGVFFFDTSPDGGTWTNQGSMAYAWNAKKVQLAFTCWYYGGYGATSGFSPMEVGNINSSGTPAVRSNGQVAATVNPGSASNYNLSQGNGAGLSNIYLEMPNAALWLDLLEQSQTRTTIPIINPTFTMFEDSFQVPWTDTASLVIANGTDLETQFEASLTAFNGDWLMLPNFQLVAANDGSMGNDLSSTVVFHSSGEIITHTRTRTRDQIANYVVVSDGTGNIVYQTSGASEVKWNQREKYVESSQATDIPTLSQMANATVNEFQYEVSQRTLQVPAEYPGHTVFLDYHIGDWIGVQNANLVDIDKVRVVGASISIDGTQDFVSVELTLETRIQLYVERLNVLLQKIGANADTQVIPASGASSVVVQQSSNSLTDNTFTQIVGDGVTSAFFIGHGLNTQSVTVTVLINSTGAMLVPGATTYTVTASSINQLTVTFNSAPSINQYTVVVKK
jgi:hypothetical protein